MPRRWGTTGESHVAGGGGQKLDFIHSYYSGVDTPEIRSGGRRSQGGDEYLGAGVQKGWLNREAGAPEGRVRSESAGEPRAGPGGSGEAGRQEEAPLKRRGRCCGHEDMSIVAYASERWRRKEKRQGEGRLEAIYKLRQVVSLSTKGKKARLQETMNDT